MTPLHPTPLGIAACCCTAALGAEAVSDEAKRTYDLSPGDAITMLNRFAAVSGRQVMYVSENVRGVRTNEVKGDLSAREALDRMLAGTALKANEDRGSGVFVVSRRWLRVENGDKNRKSQADTPPARVEPAPPDQLELAPQSPKNRTETMSRKNIIVALASWLAVALAPSTHAQASANIASATSQQTPHVLSPFEVTSSKDEGYIATNSLSGSRINTPLYTTPSVISVFTRDFLDDIAANDLVEAYAFALNVDALEQPEQSSNFRPNLGSDSAVNIRGLAAATARNYFVWDVNGDSYNLERIDFSRGPNNVLFGLGGFGGVVNSTTKRAVIGRDVTRLQLRLGDWDLYRGHLDIGRSLGNRVALRVNLLQQDEGGWKNHASYDRKAMHVAGTWRIFETPSFGTVLRGDYEKLHADRVIGNRFPFRDFVTSWNGVGIPASGDLTGVVGTAVSQLNNRTMLLQGSNQFIFNSTLRRTTGPSGTSFTDEKIAPREINMEGNPNNDTDVENFTFMLEQKLFRDFFIELAFNRQRERFVRTRADFGWDLFRDPHLTLNGAPNPHFGDYFADFQYDLDGVVTKVDEMRATASYERDLGKFGRHQIAMLGSRRKNQDDRDSFTFDDVGRNSQMVFRRYLSDGDGLSNTGFVPARIVADAARVGINAGYRQNRLTYSTSRQDTIQGVHVGNFFSGRLSTVLGLRSDRLYSRGVLNGTTNVVTDEPVFKRRRYWTNFQLTPWTFRADDLTRTKGFTLGWSADSPVRFYYNESGSFINQNVTRLVGLLDRDQGPLPRLGEGRDMGARFRILGQRIQGSFGRFKTRDRNATPGLHGYFLQSVGFVANVLRLSGLQNWNDTLEIASKGYEAEITANVTRNLRLHFNYSHTKLANSNHAPDTKNILIGQLLGEWRSWVGGWRQGPTETLPAGVSNNSAAAVNVPALGRPLTFLEAHGGGIDPVYNLRDRAAHPSSTGALGIADWISRVNWASDIWFLDGIPPRRHRVDTFNVVANYSFDRNTRLKGWTVGGGARWRGKPIQDRYFDAQSNVVEILGEPRVDTDFNVGYTHRFKRFTVKTQLNIKNVFDADTVEVINVAGNSDERGHLQYHDPRSFRLTVDFIY